MRVAALMMLFIMFGSRQLGQADQFQSQILTKQDIEYQNFTNSDGRILGSALDDPEYWESYNQWLCFPSAEIVETKTEIHGHWQQTYILGASLGNQYFEFDVPLELNWDFEKVRQEWVGLLANTSEVCILGAFLQSQKNDESLWIIQQIKTENGYWSAR
jgi:hypothetical protein